MTQIIKLSRCPGGVNNTRLTEWATDTTRLVKELNSPAIGAKDGPYFIRCAGTKRNNAHTATSAGVIILDGDSRIDADGVIKSGAPHPQAVHDVLTSLDVLHVIYSSHSNAATQAELALKPDVDTGGLFGNDFHKYRVIIPCEYEREDLPALLDHLFKALHDAGVMLAPVNENRSWSQAWYFPRVPDQQRLEAFKFFHHDGASLDVDSITMAWSPSVEQQEKFSKSFLNEKPYESLPYDTSGGRRDPIREFNQSLVCDDVLARNGYKDADMGRMIRPGSFSKIAGIAPLYNCSDGRERIYSFGGDVLNDGKAHDAFDCYRLLECGGDFNKALAWSPEITKHNQRLFMQEKTLATPIQDNIQKKNDDRSSLNEINTLTGKEIIPEEAVFQLIALTWSNGEIFKLDGSFELERTSLYKNYTAPFASCALKSLDEADFLTHKLPEYIAQREAKTAKDNEALMAKGKPPQPDIPSTEIIEYGKKFAEKVKGHTPADEALSSKYLLHERLDDDTNIPPPKGSENMLYGFVGRVAKEAANGKEVNEYAAFMYFLVALSANFGRDIYLPIGDSFHHSRLFGLHVGRSSRGRKGETMKLVDRVLSKAKEIDEKDNMLASAVCKIHKGGMSSREGLIMLIHDGLYIGTKSEKPPIDDKRLLIVESEFSNVLHQTKRDGNTLSAAIRDLFDGRDIQPAVKANPVGSTDPHCSVWGNVTPFELLELMSDREISNGFANRFLMIFAERYRLVSMPKPTAYDRVLSFALETLEIVRWAKGNYPAVKNSREAKLSDDATQAYDKIYKAIEGKNNGNLSDTLMRLSTNLLRIALTLAIVDKSLTIEAHHINTAHDWVNFSADSVRYVFASKNDEDQQAEIEATAEKIITFLTANKTATKTEIANKCFFKNLSASVIDDALNHLMLSTPPKIELTKLARKGKGFGKGAKVYSIAGLNGLYGLCDIAGLQTKNEPYGLNGLYGLCDIAGIDTSPADSTKKANSVKSVKSVQNENDPATPDRKQSPLSPLNPQDYLKTQENSAAFSSDDRGRI